MVVEREEEGKKRERIGKEFPRHFLPFFVVTYSIVGSTSTASLLYF